MGIEYSEYPMINLSYRKGDLIVKEGDYGISIYKIKKGHVRVFQEHGEKEITLATLGPGEIFGEMALLNKAVGTHSASARAMNDLELEVMHPASLSMEYLGISPVLRHIANQTLNLLLNVNKMYARLQKEKGQGGVRGLEEPGDTRRGYYRKRLNQFCTYRQVGGAGKARLEGRLIDISAGGFGMNVSEMNVLNVSHEPGDEFEVHVTLPNGREVDLLARIQTVSKMSGAPKSLRLGLQFTNLNGEAEKAVKFFMMP